MVETVQTQPATARCRPAWPKDALRISFGIIWLIDAALKWLPGFRSGYMDAIMGDAQGQPGWLKPWFDFWVNFQHPNVTFFAYLVAVVETVIALALIAGFARKLTYTAAIVFSLLIWATAEGFGGPYTVGASDIGTAIIYAVVFAALLALSYYAGPSRYSADYYIEKKISWWWRVAEMRRPVPAEVPAPAAAGSTVTTPATGGRAATRPGWRRMPIPTEPAHVSTAPAAG